MVVYGLHGTTLVPRNNNKNNTDTCIFPSGTNTKAGLGIRVLQGAVATTRRGESFIFLRCVTPGESNAAADDHYHDLDY